MALAGFRNSRYKPTLCSVAGRIVTVYKKMVIYIMVGVADINATICVYPQINTWESPDSGFQLKSSSKLTKAAVLWILEVETNVGLTIELWLSATALPVTWWSHFLLLQKWHPRAASNITMSPTRTPTQLVSLPPVALCWQTYRRCSLRGYVP